MYKLNISLFNKKNVYFNKFILFHNIVKLIIFLDLINMYCLYYQPILNWYISKNI